jgi:hypothetical protein
MKPFPAKNLISCSAQCPTISEKLLAKTGIPPNKGLLNNSNPLKTMDFDGVLWYHRAKKP